MDMRSLKIWLVAVALFAIVLVPVWQAIGHAPAGVSVAVVQVEGAADHVASVAIPDSGHHKAADHAHELPIVRLANWVPANRSKPQWSVQPLARHSGVAPSRPEQPPRS